MPRSPRNTTREKITGNMMEEAETKQNGRPIIDPNGEKRSKQISVFLTPSLYRRLTLTARFEGQKANDIINKLLDENLYSMEELDKVESTMKQALKDAAKK